MKQRRRQKRRTRKTTVYRKRGFLNHYDFAYAGRDTVNQATKVAPGVIKNASNEINKIVKQRIDPIITKGGKETELVLPKSFRGTIEESTRHLLRSSEFLEDNSSIN